MSEPVPQISSTISIDEAECRRLAELGVAIERGIRKRTGGQVRLLNVKAIEDRILISGDVSSYYAKQMALQGVFDVVDAKSKPHIELNLEVIDSRSRKTGRKSRTRNSPPAS